MARVETGSQWPCFYCSSCFNWIIFNTHPPLVPDHCPAGYFGEACTDICHCENDHSCERDTGQCPEGKCAPGFISSTGVNLANCQQCKPTFYVNFHKNLCFVFNTPVSKLGLSRRVPAKVPDLILTAKNI